MPHDPSSPPSSERSSFPSEPGSPGVSRYLDDLRDGGEALDIALRDAKRFTERSEGAGAGHVVLVADDDSDAREGLASCLRDAGFRVEQAHDGAEAVEKARALSPEIIVMDYEMPEVDGGEAIRRLGSDPQTRSIPVLLLSGYPEAIPRTVRLGCAAFLAKPCEPRELGPLLRLIIAARGADQRSAGGRTGIGG